MAVRFSDTTMSIVNTRERTINAKVVYYGPGLGGKTTSLRHVHATLDPGNLVKLVSLRTDEERTLFFDFLPVDIGILGGYRIRIQALTVPGQVKYGLTQRYVLMGTDAVVFVADSLSERLEENVASMEQLGQHLRSNGFDATTIPLILQYNKRDQTAISTPEEMDRHLNHCGSPRFLTAAIDGNGVFDAFLGITRVMVDHIAARYRLDTRPSAGDRAVELLRARATTPRPADTPTS